MIVCSTSTLAGIVRGEGGASLDVLSIDDLLAGRTPAGLPVDPYGPEGLLPVTLREAQGPEGKYLQAVPTEIIPPGAGNCGGDGAEDLILGQGAELMMGADGNLKTVVG